MTNAILNVVHNWACELSSNGNCNPQFRAALSDLATALERLRKFL